MLRFANKIGNVFNRGMSTFSKHIVPGIGRTIGEAAKIGRNIGQAAKIGRSIGQSANVISGGRLSPYTDKANEVLSKIEEGGNYVAKHEPVLKVLQNLPNQFS